MSAAPMATVSVPGKWAISIVRTAYDPVLAVQAEVSWDHLVENLTVPDVWSGEKRDLPGWIPAQFLPGETRRSARGVEAVSMLVLDLDSGDVGARGERAATAVEGDGLAGIFHTSWSHSVERPKGRLVLPFDKPCPAGRWAEVWLAAAAWAQDRGLTVDQAAKDPGRLYYMAMRRPGDASFCGWAEPGKLLSWRWLVANYAPRPEPRREFKPVRPTAERGLPGHDQRAQRQRFAVGVVMRRCREIASMGEGGRNSAVFRAAAAIGQLEAAQVLDARWAVGQLRDAALACGLPVGEVEKTIQSGLRRGEADGPWPWTKD